jgi:hypothetical protein
MLKAEKKPDGQQQCADQRAADQDSLPRTDKMQSDAQGGADEQY